jgi:hypothetical protein
VLQDEVADLARGSIALTPGAVVQRCVPRNTLPRRDGTAGVELLAAPQGLLRPACESLPALADTDDADRPFVIGLLSGSFRPYPVGWLTIAGFRTLDLAAFAVIRLTQNSSINWMAAASARSRASGELLRCQFDQR